MFTFRKHVFETNSSTTHSLILCMEDELFRWQDNDLFLAGTATGIELLTRDEVRDRIPTLKRRKFPTTVVERESFDDYAMHCGYYCYDYVRYYLNDAEASYTLPDGVRMVALSLEFDD